MKNTFLHIQGAEVQADGSPDAQHGSRRRQHSEPPRPNYSGRSQDTSSDDELYFHGSISNNNRQVSDSAALNTINPETFQGQFMLFPAQQTGVDVNRQQQPQQPQQQQPNLSNLSSSEISNQLDGLQRQHQQLLDLHQQQQQQLQQQQQMELQQHQLQLMMQQMSCAPGYPQGNRNQPSNSFPDQDNNTDDEDYIGQYSNQHSSQAMMQNSSPAAIAQAWMSQLGNSMPAQSGMAGPGQLTGKPAEMSTAFPDTGSTPEPGAPRKWYKEQGRLDQDAGSGSLDDEHNGEEAEDSGKLRKRAEDPYSWDAGVVTVMVRQLPRQLTQRMFLQEVVRRGFEGLFDFLYLPYDFKKGINVGYGFVNFTNPEYALRFRDSLDGQYLDKYMRMKSKAVRVHPAQVQGYEANFRHFSQTKTGQKQDPAFSPLFFPVSQDGLCLQLLQEMQAPGGGAGGMSGSKQSPSSSSAQASSSSSLQRKKKQPTQRNPLMQNQFSSPPMVDGQVNITEMLHAGARKAQGEPCKGQLQPQCYPSMGVEAPQLLQRKQKKMPMKNGMQNMNMPGMGGVLLMPWMPDARGPVQTGVTYGWVPADMSKMS